MLFYVVFILFGLAAQLDGYVVLQLRKQANQSDVAVDALIHKRVTRNLKDKPADHPKHSKVPSRKHNDDDDDLALEADKKVIALGLDTGVAGESKNGIVQAISDAFSDLGVGPWPYLRAQGKRAKHSGDTNKPLAVELKSEAILRSVEEFLASPKVKKITHDLARKAAIIYRAIEKEL